MTTACFEPALDYVVVKLPRWDLDKFERADRRLGPAMKSVGEVMGIGASFPEALSKAVRMSDPRSDLVPPSEVRAPAAILTDLASPTPDILYRILEGLRAGIPPADIGRTAWVDRWFINCLGEIEAVHRDLTEAPAGSFSPDLVRRAKELGLSDRAIGRAARLDEEEVRHRRLEAGIRPRTRMIDTLAGEWPARTNYLYLTYRADADDVGPMPDGSILVVGAGPYRIGSSVEFDWSTMNLADGLRAEGVPGVAVLNSNPETVSTDYDRSDRLYFEEITLERVRDITEAERFRGVVTCVGSQLAQNLTPLLQMCGIPVLGTSPESIDMAEDRARFAGLLERLRIPQPAWRAFTTLDEASRFADEVGYPVLVRPSYVLSGQAMRVIWGRQDLGRFLSEATRISPEHPVVITKFIEGADEVELDAISDGERVLVGGILEHVERAGIHSGDAIFCLPPRHTPPEVQAQLLDAAGQLARTLAIRGPFNVQFLVKDRAYQIIELNLRASRSLPFLTKATGVPLLREAARAMLGRPISREGVAPLPPGRFGVKVPQFSFLQLTGSDPLLGVEMQSTGEVACFGPTFADALVKALVATGVRLIARRGSAFLSVGGPLLKERAPPGRPAIARSRPPHRGDRGHGRLPPVARDPRGPHPPQGLRARPTSERPRGDRPRGDRRAPERPPLADTGEVRADARGRVRPPPAGRRARHPAVHEPRSVRGLHRGVRLARGAPRHGRRSLRQRGEGRGRGPPSGTAWDPRGPATRRRRNRRRVAAGARPALERELGDRVLGDDRRGVEHLRDAPDAVGDEVEDPTLVRVGRREVEHDEDVPIPG